MFYGFDGRHAIVQLKIHFLLTLVINKYKLHETYEKINLKFMNSKVQKFPIELEDFIFRDFFIISLPQILITFYKKNCSI